MKRDCVTFHVQHKIDIFLSPTVTVKDINTSFGANRNNTILQDTTAIKIWTVHIQMNTLLQFCGGDHFSLGGNSKFSGLSESSSGAGAVAGCLLFYCQWLIDTVCCFPSFYITSFHVFYQQHHNYLAVWGNFYHMAAVIFFHLYVAVPEAKGWTRTSWWFFIFFQHCPMPGLLNKLQLSGVV